MIHLKPDYNGMIISRTYPGVGTIIFNSMKINPQYYHNYRKCGFEDLFVICDDSKPLECPICVENDKYIKSKLTENMSNKEVYDYSSSGELDQIIDESKQSLLKKAQKEVKEYSKKDKKEK